MKEHVSFLAVLLGIAFVLSNVSMVVRQVHSHVVHTFEVYFPPYISSIVGMQGNISQSTHNISLKGFAPCNTSADCALGGACVSNHFGFILKDDYEFVYRKPNGEIKTRHWLVVDQVEKGSPADIVGKLNPGDILEGKY
jgi:hypothetical protein